MVQQQRDAAADDGEPLFDEEMSLQPRGGSVQVTIPSTGAKILGLEPGMTRCVEVYREGIWIPRGGSDE